MGDSFFDRDKTDATSDNTLNDEELDFLVGEETKILNARDCYCWDEENANKIIKNDLETDFSQKHPVAPSISHQDVRIDDILPDLDLTGLNEEDESLFDQDEFVSEEEHLPDLDLLGLFDDEEQDPSPEQSSAAGFHEEPDYQGQYVGEHDDFTDECCSGEECELSEDDEELIVDDNDLIYYVPEEESHSENDDSEEWYLVDEDIDEFETGLSSVEDEVDVEGGLTREARAFQVASEVGILFFLGKEDVEVLSGIFFEHGWAQCKESIIRELTDGKTIDELHLASEVKQLWLEHCEFYSGQLSNFKILSWPTALKLIDQFTGIPSIEEIERLLDSLYHHWMDSRLQRAMFKTFNEYLIASLHYGIENFDFSQEWQIALDKYDANDIYLPPSSLDIPVLRDYELERALRIKRLHDTAPIGGTQL